MLLLQLTSVVFVSFAVFASVGRADDGSLAQPPIPAGTSLPVPTVTPVDPASKPNWQRILTCDQGRFWIDVDLNERRNLQLVSRDTTANGYLTTLAVLPTTQSSDLAQMTFNVSHEVGIFKASDFAIASGQSSVNLAAPTQIGDDYMTQFSVMTRAFRDAGSGGVKLEFVRTAMQICTFFDLATNTCNGTYGVRDRYIGNWYFANCQ